VVVVIVVIKLPPPLRFYLPALPVNFAHTQPPPRLNHHRAPLLPTPSLFYAILWYLHMHAHTVCVCVPGHSTTQCVCERERERERETSKWNHSTGSGCLCRAIEEASPPPLAHFSRIVPQFSPKGVTTASIDR